MHVEAIVVEQTRRNRFQQPPPPPPREIELMVRLEVPEESGADVGIDVCIDPPLLLQWEDTRQQRTNPRYGLE